MAKRLRNGETLEDQPQASGLRLCPDEKTGDFKDPAGGTGSFPSGAAENHPAENWVDLMLGPLPMWSRPAQQHRHGGSAVTALASATTASVP